MPKTNQLTNFQTNQLHKKGQKKTFPRYKERRTFFFIYATKQSNLTLAV
jgi:hypothetical protein